MLKIIDGIEFNYNNFMRCLPDDTKKHIKNFFRMREVYLNIDKIVLKDNKVFFYEDYEKFNDEKRMKILKIENRINKELLKNGNSGEIGELKYYLKKIEKMDGKYYSISAKKFLGFSDLISLYLCNLYIVKYKIYSDSNKKKELYDAIKSFTQDNIHKYKTGWKLKISDLNIIEFDSIVTFCNLEQQKIYNIEKNIEFIKHNFIILESDKKEKILDKIAYQLKKKNNNLEINKKIDEKVEYLKRQEFSKIHIGKENFDGYIAVELNDGKILLDKLGYGNAMFIVLDDDIEKILQLTRTELRSEIKDNLINGVYITHNENWQEKADSNIRRLKK